MIYFIQIEEYGPIKVGYTYERTAERRLTGLQTACPYRLILRGVIQGDESEESKILKYLAAHRLRGEWFAPHPFVIDTIQGMVGKWDHVEPTVELPKIDAAIPFFVDHDISELVSLVVQKYGLRAQDVVTEAIRDGLIGFLNK
jgi:hypothetical protein